MKRNQTMYDEVGDILMEFAVLVSGIAEISTNDMLVHKAKVKAVLDLKDATRSVIMSKVVKKIDNHASCANN